VVGPAGTVTEPDVSVTAVPSSIAGLKNGGVSITLHVPSQQADQAFGLHKLQGKTVTLDIYLMEED
jgi:hypothetical protein